MTDTGQDKSPPWPLARALQPLAPVPHPAGAKSQSISHHPGPFQGSEQELRTGGGTRGGDAPITSPALPLYVSQQPGVARLGGTGEEQIDEETLMFHSQVLGQTGPGVRLFRWIFFLFGPNFQSVWKKAVSSFSQPGSSPKGLKLDRARGGFWSEGRTCQGAG